jgi:hypothetical protein
MKITLDRCRTRPTRRWRRVTAGEVLHLEPTDVMVLREDPS